MQDNNTSGWLQGQPTQARQRAALEAVRKAAADPTLAVGDVVFCRGAYATVTEIITLAPGTHTVSPIRNDWTAVKVVTDNGTRWHGIEPEPQSAYTPCACRDCMDTTVSSNTSSPELCSECKDAGCVPWAGELAAIMAGAYECQRGDAYEG